MNTRMIVLSAITAALYAVMTIMLAPIGYAALQFRVAVILYGLALFDPVFAFGLALGVFLADLASPFGAFDFIPMPIIALVGSLIAYKLRRWPLASTILLSIIISAGVSIFPLGLGGQLPFWATFPPVLAAQLILIVGGWLIIWGPLRNPIGQLVRSRQ